MDLERQLLPGTFEHALNYLIDHEINLKGFDGRYRNDFTGAAAYPPALLLQTEANPPTACGRSVLSEKLDEGGCAMRAAELLRK